MHDVIRFELQHAEAAAFLGDRGSPSLGEAQLTTSTLSPRLSKPMAERLGRDAVQVFLRRAAGRWSRLCRSCVVAVDQHATEMRLTRPGSVTSVRVVREIS